MPGAMVRPEQNTCVLPRPKRDAAALERSLAHDRTDARRWLGLAVGSLVLAGFFSLLLVVARLPLLDRLFHDPVFFKRCLVVHVNLALVVWFYAFIAALFFTLPSRRPAGPLARAGAGLALAGIGAMMLGAGMQGAEPVLSNYVPVIDHPLFLAGQVVFGAGVLLAVLQPRLLPGNEGAHGFFALPPAARPGLRAAAIVLLLAALTFAGAWIATPATLGPQAYYELVAWGGGHVLQVASVAAMLAVWVVLLTSALGRSPLPRRATTVLFALLALPMAAAPLLALRGTVTPEYRVAFTRMMELGIFPVVMVFLVACLRALRSARRDGRLPPAGLRDGRILGFFASAALSVLGFALGAAIGGANTLIPAHYHASIGAVTAAFMAVTYLLLAPLGLRLGNVRRERCAAWQPLIFGAGQLVFASGFALAGAYGMLRKTYGVEQQARTWGEIAGLSVMGAGGLLAVAGGLLFLGLVIGAWRRRIPRTAHRPGALFETNDGGTHGRGTSSHPGGAAEASPAALDG